MVTIVRKLFQRASAFAPTLGLLLAFALVGLLVTQSRGQRREIARLRFESRVPHVGAWVPALRTATVAGDSITLAGAAPGRRQVVFFFTTTCQYCHESISAWKQIAERIRRESDGQDEVLAVALDSLPLAAAYVQKHGITYSVTHFPDERLARVFSARAVPFTIVIGGNGRVEYARGRAITTSAGIDSVVQAARPSVPAAIVANVP